jgi:hypothetical protein
MIPIVSSLAAASAFGLASSVAVVEPSGGETVFSNPGVVEVQLASDAALAPGQRIELWVDGAPLPPATTAEQVTLSGLNRGEHTVGARLLDRDGRIVDTADPVTFYVWKASRPFPNR